MTEPTFADYMAARWAPMYRVAYVLAGNAHDAEDLLQSAMAKTCLKWDTIRDKGAVDAYVRRAMTNELTSRWRRPLREVATETLPEHGHSGGLDLRDDQLVLWEHIKRLPARMRATLVLRYVQDLTEAQTAEELGISVGSVKSQTHKALQRLRAALPEMELELCR
jgi:RNA polymerase sigma-70 factor (sigma-E family)